MSGIQLTIVLGHPLALPPPVMASAAVAPEGGVQWTTAWSQDGDGAPGPIAPPVIT